ncbi:toll/interleukin-1 receptor domain-containing protein [Arenimonas aestuarii]
MKFNGKPFNANDFSRALKKAATKIVADELRERVSSIRDPESGEFATVVVDGESLEDMSLRIEGTPSLLERVREDIGVETDLSGQSDDTITLAAPKVFLSFGWEDRDLAGRIAHALQSNGISTWWSEWEILAGESIRRKVDQGIGECTHFVVLLTPSSIDRPWVQEEMDAGFVQKVSRDAKFIGLRHGIETKQLPPLLAGSLSPHIDADLTEISQLINDIHGVSRKPALGPAPAITTLPKARYSPAAMAIAKVFVEQSRHGTLGDVQSNQAELIQKTSLPEDDVVDALHELRHWLKTGYGTILPKQAFYAEFDAYWMPWNPADDALRLASELVNDPDFPKEPSRVADRYGWEPRRLNPAMAYLDERGAARITTALATGPYIGYEICRTDATRRFVRSRS